MPYIFKVEPYTKRIVQGRAAIGDVVYITSQPDLPMTVCAEPHHNRAAGRIDPVKTRWLKPDGTFESGEFNALELST